MLYKYLQSLVGAVKQKQYFLVIFVHFLYFKIFIIIVCRYGFFACLGVYEPFALRSQEKALNFLALEFQRAVICYMDARTQTWVLWKSS